jgi:hypothetical protein
MRPCPRHWAAMRKALDDRGLTKFVAGSGEEAAERVTNSISSALEGEEEDVKNWDPLMAMNFNFGARLLEGAGIGVMAPREDEQNDGMPPNDGHVCPLCLVLLDFNAHHPDHGGRCGKPECTIHHLPGAQPTDEMWIEGCADAMLAYAREHNLIQMH